ERTTRQLFAESEKEIEGQFAIDEQGFRDWAKKNGWKGSEIVGSVHLTPSISDGPVPSTPATITNGLEATNMSRGVSNSYLAIYDRATGRAHYTFQSRQLEENKGM